MPAHSVSGSGAVVEGLSFAADGKVAALDAATTNTLGGAGAFTDATMRFDFSHGSCGTPASAPHLGEDDGDGPH